MQNAPFFNSRSRVSTLYIALVVMGIIFIGRLFYLQVIQHSHFKAQALAEHESKFTIPAERGLIYALDGDSKVPLVLNEVMPTIYADPEGVEDTDVDSTAQALASTLQLNKDEVAAKLRTPDSRYQVIAKKVSQEKVDLLKQQDLGGIGFTDESYRVYPQNQLGSQLLGFVNAENEGQYGIEGFLDKALHGKDGRLKAVTDVHGIPLSSEDNVIEQPIHGSDLTLTIDVNIQRFVEEALKANVERSEGKAGSAIVYDPYSGSVLAMANYPTYNPNEINKVEDYHVFQNDVVNRAYETGSGMKVFTMSTGLNEGVVTPDSTYFDKGYEIVDGQRIENAAIASGYTRSMYDVIQYSINTGAVHVLKQLGGGEINEQARSTLRHYFTDVFNFGQPTGIAQSGEVSGWLADVNTGAGDNIRYANMTFGQGMTVSMLQMVAALSSVINGGTYYQPHVLMQNGSSSDPLEPQAVKQNVVKPEVSQNIIEMMQNVVRGGGGTVARRDGYMIGGKTGTSQVIGEDGTYSDYREVGSFTGWGGGDKPEYVIMTRIDEPQIGGYAGSVAAAPLFADISNFMIDYWQIPPQQ